MKSCRNNLGLTLRYVCKIINNFREISKLHKLYTLLLRFFSESSLPLVTLFHATKRNNNQWRISPPAHSPPSRPSGCSPQFFWLVWQLLRRGCNMKNMAAIRSIRAGNCSSHRKQQHVTMTTMPAACSLLPAPCSQLPAHFSQTACHTQLQPQGLAAPLMWCKLLWLLLDLLSLILSLPPSSHLKAKQ